MKALGDFGLDEGGGVMQSAQQSVKQQNEKENAARKKLEEALRKGNMDEILKALKVTIVRSANSGVAR